MTKAKKATIMELCARDVPLILPGAHDALSAKIIEHVGFDAYFIGGFTVVGVRYGVPDLGLMALGEIGSAVADIVRACSLPVLVDGDTGYGDEKNIVNSLHFYETIGVSGVMFEDQAWPKRCGHIYGKALVDADVHARKIRAASQEKITPDTFILARTDAREVLGLDEALRRGERYLEAGADGVFIESPMNIEELEIVGAAFDVPQLANMAEGGRTPILPPDELHQMGFEMVTYGISAMLHAAKAMEGIYRQMAAGKVEFAGSALTFSEYNDIVGFSYWSDIENKYAQPDSERGRELLPS
jgi:2-methylisocitrate lyase-like PEP mutase family enzyme